MESLALIELAKTATRCAIFSSGKETKLSVADAIKMIEVNYERETCFYWPGARVVDGELLLYFPNI